MNSVDPNPPPDISDLTCGDHLCCIFETDEQHRALLTSFLRQGLERNGKVVYIADTRTAEAVLGYVKQEGLDPHPLVEIGRLTVLSAEDVYMREGVFVPDRMISFLRTLADQAVAEGYDALHVTGEMSWALRGLHGTETDRLIEYESKLDAFLPDSRCVVLCQYDRRLFSPALLVRVLATHRVAVVGTEAFENPHCIPPEAFLTREFPTAVLDHWIEGLRGRRDAKRAEESLRRSEEKFKYVFDHSIIGKSLTLPTGELYVNDAFCELLGYSREELVSRRWQDITPSEDIELVQRSIDPLLAGERESVRFVKRYLHNNGSIVWAEVATSLRRDEKGKPLHFLTSINDITERKRAEEVRSHLASIVESSDDAIIGKTLEGTVTSWNRGAERLYGYAAAEALGRKVSFLVPPDCDDDVP
ncbi:MAG: MEDS domain-containing protein, partial [Deltaproteobacteria bacterium]|nr:MEDS domain-containing protein [Deltaproteobacteria bacterium]